MAKGLEVARLNATICRMHSVLFLIELQTSIPA
jgi:hypothetical protein